MSPNLRSAKGLLRACLGRRAFQSVSLIGVASAGAYLGVEANWLRAYHEGPVLHITTMHHGDSNWEFICVDNTRTNPPVAISTIYNKVKATLWEENPDRDWDNVDGTRRVFWSVFAGDDYKDCDWLYYNDRPTYDEIIVKYRADDDTSNAPCGDGDGVDEGISCVYHDGPVTFEGHSDFHYAYAHIERDRFTVSTDARRRHTINHETGHVLGFADPGVGNQPNGCYDQNGNPIVSVMHSSFYCPGFTDYQWPTDGDRYVLVSIMNEK